MSLEKAREVNGRPATPCHAATASIDDARGRWDTRACPLRVHPPIRFLALCLLAIVLALTAVGTPTASSGRLASFRRRVRHLSGQPGSGSRGRQAGYSSSRSGSETSTVLHDVSSGKDATRRSLRTGAGSHTGIATRSARTSYRASVAVPGSLLATRSLSDGRQRRAISQLLIREELCTSSISRRDGA